mmetsp:Transcript_31992/g.37622  ORF Transcript_31992/g.37622 Transcript_31992/m.37622 type:complete len:82 (-) Transcript_31992:837-1082(-)
MRTERVGFPVEPKMCYKRLRRRPSTVCTRFYKSRVGNPELLLLTTLVSMSLPPLKLSRGAAELLSAPFGDHTEVSPLLHPR